MEPNDPGENFPLLNCDGYGGSPMRAIFLVEAKTKMPMNQPDDFMVAIRELRDGHVAGAFEARNPGHQPILSQPNYFFAVLVARRITSITSISMAAAIRSKVSKVGFRICRST